MDVSDAIKATLYKYSTCLSYSDRGYYCDNASGTPTIRFSTYFRRPTSVRFEWSGETKLSRVGCDYDSSKSTVLRCAPGGVCTYSDPRNLEEPRIIFGSPTEMFQFDKLFSGRVTELILPLILSEFGSSTRLLSKKIYRTMQRVAEQDDFAFCAEKSYKQYFQYGPVTVTDSIWIDNNLHIRRFRQQATLKAANKRPGIIRKELYKVSPAAYELYFQKDQITVYDYHFDEVSFDCDIDDALFCKDQVESETTKL